MKKSAEKKKEATAAPFSQLMDSLYEEEPWWDTDKQQPRINPSHFDPNARDAPVAKNGVSPSSDRKATLVRTLSSKFTKNAVTKEVTGRKPLTRSVLGSLDRAQSSSERIEIADSYLYDPKAWLEAMSAAKTAQGRSQLRLFVSDTTRSAAREEHYWIMAGKEAVAPRRVPLSVHAHTLENVAVFDFEGDSEPGRGLKEARFAGTAHFVYADVVDVGVFMKQEQRCDPLVLVFAHPTVLGGAQDGGVSQEEYVLRRTNLASLVNNDTSKPVVRNWTYSLPQHGGIYVPSASVIRSNESTGYKFLVNPIRLSFMLASAPLNETAFKVNNDPSFVADWRRRIDSVLAVALQKGHDSVVLGAWGCGEMGNNCGQVAALFREAVTTRFRGCFKHIVFSFLHDPEAFKAFGEAFGAPKMPYPSEADLYDRKKRASRKGLVDAAVVAAATAAAQRQLSQLTMDSAARVGGQQVERADEEEEALDWRNTDIAW